MHRRLHIALLLLAAAAGLYWGWRVFWYLTDDAHIAFRYVSNSILGFGYVWNAPPFLPVEGYTSFLWVAMLDLTWRLTGLEPPVTSNALSLAISFGTLVVAAFLTLRVSLGARLRPIRLLLVAWVLLACLTNRTFLAWTSSGLETALFNFLFLAWFASMVARGSGTPLRSWTLRSALASLLILTRPDGLLYAGATLVAWTLSPIGDGEGRPAPWKRLLSLSPFLIPLAHLLWRKHFYGEWLPNTYYAKITGTWPEAGLRYAGSFFLEYGLLVPLLFAVFAARTWWRRRLAPSELLRRILQPPGLAVLAALAHLAYYTLVVGGDHFEFRVYSHIVPLLYVGCVWMLAAASASRLQSALLLTGFLLLGCILPWTHWRLSQQLSTRNETRHMHVSVSDHLPRGFHWYASAYDDLQSWLIDRSICMRHQEHKVFYEMQRAQLPSREEGLKVEGAGFPVFAAFSIGIKSWVLPHVNIIDRHGLNDYVVARSPVRRADRGPRYIRGRRIPDRQMAHERFPPPEYEEAFGPNVWLPPSGGIVVFPRSEPLTASRIREIERHWRKTIRELPAD